MADGPGRRKLSSMKKIILLSTSYPYTTGIIAVMWLGSVVLLGLDKTLSTEFVVFVNVLMTFVIASIGFRR